LLSTVKRGLRWSLQVHIIFIIAIIIVFFHTTPIIVVGLIVISSDSSAFGSSFSTDGRIATQTTECFRDFCTGTWRPGAILADDRDFVFGKAKTISFRICPCDLL